MRPLNGVDDTIARLKRRVVDERKAKIRAWLDSDPSLRPTIIEGEPKLKALARHVERLERLAVGFRRP